MQQFRSFVKGPVGVALLVLFTIPFIITGFYGYFTTSPASGSAVAEVNGVDIKAEALQRQVQMMRQQLRQQSPNVDPAIIDGFIQPATVLNGLVNNQLLLSEAEEGNLLVSQAQAGRLVVEAPQVVVVEGVHADQEVRLAVEASRLPGPEPVVRGDAGRAEREQRQEARRSHRPRA